MTRAAIWALFILATAAVIAGLVYFKDTLTQITLALILFLGAGGMARWIKKTVPILPRWAAALLAVAVIVALLTLVTAGIVDNIDHFRQDVGAYQHRLNEVVRELYGSIGLAGRAPTITALLSSLDAGQVLSFIAAGFQSFVSNAIFIIIYLGFLLAAAPRMAQKLDQLFANPKERTHARAVVTAIRESMEQYLWVQTVISVITTALTFVTLKFLGLEHALFWSFLIFFLNYIPTIGSIIAVILPTLFALVQFDHLSPVLFVALGIGFWQFMIGNIIQPRMMGQSLNLSSLVVLLALALWGTIWGITGAFLAAPLTVMIMIVLAQFEHTRWISVLLSADGRPSVLAARQGRDADDDATNSPKQE